ncbi:MAG: hypothetical protein LC114_06690 [Bryobacterales bacterium]|nr:hypothetical protein [Bryobacterales bacterium]
MFRFGYLAVLIVALLIFPTITPAVTTPKELRVALQELTSLASQEDPRNPPSKGVLEQTVRLRHRLRDYGIGGVTDNARLSATLDAVLPNSERRLNEAGFPLRPTETESSSTPVKATAEFFAIPGAAEWLGLKTTVRLACGSDYALYYFHLIPSPDGGFEASLAFAKENSLESVADLASAFAAAAEPSPQGDTLRIATIEASGGCSSLWRPVKMRVFQTDAHPYRPLRIFEKERLAYLGEEPLPHIGTWPEGFEFVYRTLYSLDAERHSREEVIRLAQEAQGVRVLPPPKGDPLSFVDEWVSAPWAEAQRWVSDNRLGEIRKWHQKLSGGVESRLRTELVNAGECPRDGEVWVHVRAGESYERMRSIYGLLRAEADSYRVERFVSELPASCEPSKKTAGRP